MSCNSQVAPNPVPKNKKDLKLDFWSLTIIVAFICLGIFIIYPFLNLFLKSFFVEGTKELTLDYYIKFFTTPYYIKGLKRSLITATYATIAATLLGIPMAYILTRYNIIGKKVLNIMIILSLLSPPFIGAYSWIMLLGRNGILTKLLAKIGITVPPIYGFNGIILVYALNLFPHIYLFVSGALKSIDSSLEEAAENLGSTKIERLFKVTLPIIFPTITSGMLVVFMTSLAGLGTPMLIGEGYKVLPVMIYEEFMSEIGGDAAVSSTISVILVSISTMVLFLQKWLVSKKNYMMSSLRPPVEEKLATVPRVLMSLLCFLVAFTGILPQIVVFITSFKKTNGPIFVEGWSFDSYRDIAIRLAKDIKNSYTYASVAIVVMVIVGVLIAYIIVRKQSKASEILDAMVMVPYVMPGAVLAISLVIAFNKKPFILTGTWMIMVISFIIRKIPYTIRSSSAILHQIDPSIDEASINLGVPPGRTFFKITLPIMAPGVVSGAILSWVTTINELSASIILYTGKTGTIPVAIYTEVVRGSFGTAASMGTILIITTITSLLLMFKITGQDSISF